MNFADIKRVDVANGPGIRVSLFVSGCTHHCPECFNPETWDFAFGKPFTQKEIDEIFALMDHSYIRGLSLLGGEPFEPENQESVLELIHQTRAKFPEKDIWCYTGYLFEPWAEGKIGMHSRSMLEGLDVLVDGPFRIAEKDLSLRFCGSRNQRLIDVPATLKAGSIVLWDEPLF